MTRFDVAIVGAGIAGASLAAELGGAARVLLLEAEDQPGYHATGRSAAFWSETYGGPAVQPLTSASGPWLAQPPPAFSDRGFLSPRGALQIARRADAAALDRFMEMFRDSGVKLVPVDPRTMVAGLREGWTEGVMEPSCQDIDVGALHGAYLAAARRAGAELQTRTALLSARREGGEWLVETRAGVVRAAVLVNAAGAWADTVAVSAGVAPIGMQPLRRTMVQLRLAEPVSGDLPLVQEAGGRFYFKAEAGGRLWLSPHDEIPDTPRDVAPEEIDVATAIDRLEGTVTWPVRAVERRWAGLRSFAPDRLPVIGWDGVRPGFFWFAGQGGFGIQTAPAAAKLGACAILDRAPDEMVAKIDPAIYAPSRFHPRRSLTSG